jgi:hypothetical protein
MDNAMQAILRGKGDAATILKDAGAKANVAVKQ